MNIHKLLIEGTLALVAGMPCRAGAEETFDPQNPPEPAAAYKLTVKAEPAEMGWTSGTGRYKGGTQVYVSTSARDIDYRFKHWLLDGEVYTTSSSFYFRMPKYDTTLTAVYELAPFDPDSPADPMMQYKQRVYVDCDPEDACSFNIAGGSRYTRGSTITLYAYASQSFEFCGWYRDGRLISETNPLYYTIPDTDSRLTARFVYNPDSPGDPEGGQQTDVDMGLAGDVNDDGEVDAADVVSIVNHFLNPAPYTKKKDIDRDGNIDVTDVTSVINIYHHR